MTDAHSLVQASHGFVEQLGGQAAAVAAEHADRNATAHERNLSRIDGWCTHDNILAYYVATLANGKPLC